MALPSLNFATTNVQVARVVAALYGAKLGQASMAEARTFVNANSVADLTKGFLDADFTLTTDTALAALVVSNLQITDAANVAIAESVVMAGLTAATDTAGKAAAIVSVLDLYASLVADATWGTYFKDYNALVAQALTWANTTNSPDAPLTPVDEFYATLGQDAQVGSSHDDVFVARIVNGADTFQSGDQFDGGIGADQLTIYLSDDETAILAESTSVETIVVQAQKEGDANDDAGNNMVKTNESRIDAQFLEGVTRWENNQSRADLVIEDVRIPTAITRDVKIAMVSTDPGNVDFGLYYDMYSLRDNSGVAATGSKLSLELMNTQSYLAGKGPLVDTPQTGFKFLVGATEVTVTSTDIKNAGQGSLIQTGAQILADYSALVTAINAALAAAGYDGLTPGKSKITAALGETFDVTDTLTGTAILDKGYTLVLTNEGPETLSVGTTDVWVFDAGTPGNSSLHNKIYQGAGSAFGDLLTASIILDDVGRKSNGGDLVVGGLSVGDTSTSMGVDQFDIFVDRDSRLQNIASTDNWLKVVTIRSDDNNADNSANTNGGLWVRGEDIAVDADGTFGTVVGAADAALPGIVSTFGGDQADNYGFNDVMVIDATNMKGALAIDAVLTSRAAAKYYNLVDDANDGTAGSTHDNPATDNEELKDGSDSYYRPASLDGTVSSQPVSIDGFKYTMGQASDTFALNIDKGNLAQADGTTTREDFVLNVVGGSGDDTLFVQVGDGAGTDTSAWYINSAENANMNLNGDAGHDTIMVSGAGDFYVNGGESDEGDDTVYVDNSGSDANTYNSGRAAWVFNQDSRLITDLVTDNVDTFTNGTNYLFKAKVVVDFRGFTATATIPVGSNYRATDLHLNQAIKEAINNNGTLNELLIAEDGPAGTLTVRSLIDGVHLESDLSLSLTGPVAGDFSQTEVQAYNTANSTTHTDATALANAVTSVVSTWNTTKGTLNDYAGDLALSAAGEVDVTNFTLGATTAAEVVNVQFGAGSVGGGTTIVMGGTTVTIAAGSIANTAVATAVINAVNADAANPWTASASATAGKVVFTRDYAGSVIDTVFGDFNNGGGGLAAAIAAPDVVVTTQGVYAFSTTADLLAANITTGNTMIFDGVTVTSLAADAVETGGTATFGNASPAGGTITFAGTNIAIAGGALAAAVGIAVRTAINADTANPYNAVDDGAGMVTLTRDAGGATKDVVAADFGGTGVALLAAPVVTAPTTQGRYGQANTDAEVAAELAYAAEAGLVAAGWVATANGAVVTYTTTGNAVSNVNPNSPFALSTTDGVVNLADFTGTAIASVEIAGANSGQSNDSQVDGGNDTAFTNTAGTGTQVANSGDVIVLATGTNSNNALEYTSDDFGSVDYVVNFDHDMTRTSVDVIDLSAFNLTGLADAGANGTKYGLIATGGTVADIKISIFTQAGATDTLEGVFYIDFADADNIASSQVSTTNIVDNVLYTTAQVDSFWLTH